LVKTVVNNPAFRPGFVKPRLKVAVLRWISCESWIPCIAL
jgi:hypothetical protein